MFRHSLLGLSIMLVVAIGSGRHAFAQAAPAAAFKDGQPVEVREGDEWSSATVVKREGRKYQIKYEDGTEEWVTAERIKAKGAAAPADAAGKPDAGKPDAGKPAPAAKPPANAKPAWRVGQAVQAKWVGNYWDATIKKVSPNGWYQVLYSDGTWEWIEPWRIRAAGSTEEIGGIVHPRSGENETTPAPTVAPSPTPGGTPAPGGQGGASVKPAKREPLKVAVGQKVETKWGGLYRKATVKNKAPNGWVLVNYEPGAFWEWVEPWRVREIGSTADDVGYASPNKTLRKAEPPPKENPGTAPEPQGMQAAGAKEQAAESAFKENPAYKVADWSAAAAIDVLDVPDAWALAADPAPDAVRKLPARGVPLRGAGTDPFDRMTGVAVSRGGSGVAVVSHGQVTGREKGTRLERVDLAAGKSTGVIDVGRSVRVLGVSPDGKSVLVRSAGFHFGESDRIEVWPIGDGGATPAAAPSLLMFPYGDASWSTRDVSVALFLDDARFVTVGRNGKLGVWDAKAGKAQFVLASGAGTGTPALSAGGKYLAVGVGTDVIVFDAKTIKPLARVPFTGAKDALLSFSPSGRRLIAWRAAGTFTVWDATTGKVVREGTIRGAAGGESVGLVSDDHALVGGSILLDIRLGVPLWRYEASEAPGDVTPGGSYVYAIKDSATRAAALTTAVLPHPAAVELAKTLDPAAVLLLKPGTRVSLEVNVFGDERQAIVDHLTAELTRLGVTIADGSPVRLVASTSTGKTKEVGFAPFHAPPWSPPTEKVTITEQLAKLELLSDGKVAWQASSFVDPGAGMIRLKEGQTVAAVVAERSKPSVGFMSTVTIPQGITVPREPAWYGAGALGVRGPEAGKAIDAGGAGAAGGAKPLPF